MEPTLESRGETLIIGIAARTSNAAEANPGKAKIPQLWKRFFEEWVEDRIPNRKSPGTPVAAYGDYENDHTGEYSLVVGSEVTSLAEVPEGMVSVHAPAQDYLVFTAVGAIPEIVIETWAAAWRYFAGNPRYCRAYSTDIEVYGRDGATGQAKVAIHVAVRPAPAASPEREKR